MIRASKSFGLSDIDRITELRTN